MFPTARGWTVGVLFVGVACAPVGTAEALGWGERAPLGVPRQEVATAELGGKVYVGGGFRADASVADTLEVYDPRTDRWSAAAPLPIPLHHPAAAAVGGKLYVIGGFAEPFVPRRTVFEYDPVQDTWTTRAPMPTARGAFGAAVLDGKIYAAGGSPAARERDFAVYDPALDQWTVLPDMPTARNHLAGVVAGGRFYAIGGRSGSLTGVLSAVEEFDPGSNTWTTRTPMPTARGAIAGAAVGQHIVIFGGEGNTQSPAGVFEEVEAYDTVADTWISLPPMPTPRHGIGAAVIGPAVHIPGGGAVQGFGPTGVHEVFDAHGIAGFLGVTCDAATSQETYRLGDVVTASSLRILNLGVQPVSVEVKAWFEPPQSPPTGVFSVGARDALMPPPGFTVDLGPLTLFEVSATTPRGTYRFGCRTLDPVTGEERTLDLDTFEIE
jgi:N-acetylneuraminic acid mutarotase